MVKDEKKEEIPKKKNGLVVFLKKRAPFYLAAIALIIISVQGMLSEKNLENSLPEFSAEEQRVVDILMKYDGGNGGYTMMNAISSQIEEAYPDEKVFDHRKTVVELSVSNVDLDEYSLVLNFKSHKDEINFNWNVNTGTGKITSDNSESKHLIDLVDFYD
jgi:uncharacterized protein YneR